MQDPIFILSLRPRSGTNLLHYHLCQHPDTVASSLNEDYVAAHLGSAERFVESFAKQQSRWLQSDEVASVKTYLRQCLAYGLKGLMHTPSEKFADSAPSEEVFEHRHQRLVTKTPNISGIERIRSYFPQAQILTLLRDPRDVIDSEMMAFGFDFTKLVLAWRETARAFLACHSKQENAEYLKIVRYENLYLNPIETIVETLEFLNLDKDLYDFNNVKNAPILGSSSDLAKGQWSVSGDRKDFAPLGKWKSWKTHRIDFFERTAGAEAALLGYPLAHNPEG